MSRIFKKLFLTYVLILVVCLSILGPIIGASLKNYYKDRLSHELWSSSVLTEHIIKENFVKGDLSDIQLKSTQIGKELKARVTIIDKDGVVLGDSEKDPLQMENHKNRPEIKEALTGGVGKSIRFSNTLKTHMMYVAIPIMIDSRVLGVVRLSFPLIDVKAKVNYIYKVIFLGCILGALFALGLSILIGNSFVRPIKQMEEVTQKIASGDFSQRVRIETRDELGNLAGHLNQMADELEEKIAEITKDKKELEAILSSMVEGVIVIGRDEKIILLGSPVYKMFDIRTRDAVGKPYWEVIRNEGINFLLRECIKNKKALKREIYIISPDESYFDVQVSPVLTESGELLGIVAVFHNITELKRINKMRTEFTANVSHELKTPLTSIKGFVETLLDGAVEDKQKAKEFLGIIQVHTDKLQNLINDLLILSKIESKEIKMDIEHIKLPEVIERVVTLYKDKIEEKQHTLNINIQDNIPSILADERKLEQVFSNLLDNAIKFTPPGGKLSINAKEEKNYIIVEIQDTGTGIPEEHLPHIFERFYRVDKARSRELGGTGLGLSIVKHIMEAHDGKVRVESLPGKGSSFSVYIPKNPLAQS